MLSLFTVGLPLFFAYKETGFSLYIISLIWTTALIAGIIDITQEAYITEQVHYYRSDASNTRNSLVASESIQVTTPSGSTIILKGATRHFPYGKYTGTVTYAKNSRIVISFVPD